jgi:hypothetical protein
MILAAYQVTVTVSLLLAFEMRVLSLDMNVILALVRANWASNRLEAFPVLLIDFSSHWRKFHRLANVTFPTVQERQLVFVQLTADSESVQYVDESRIALSMHLRQ